MAGFPLWSSDPEFEFRFVQFRPQGTSAPIKDYGNNVTIARTGVGTYTATWSDKPQGFTGFEYQVGNSLANDIRRTGAGYTESTGVATFTIFADSTTAAAAADIPANANNIVTMWFVFRRRKVSI